MLITDVPRKKSNFKPGENPNSLENLIHEGRPMVHGQPKKRREVMVTDDGWEGFKALAQRLGLSASEVVERLGRGLSKHPDDIEQSEDQSKDS